MHPMQPPEERHGVEHHVLTIDREIEHKHGTWNCEPGRDRDIVKQAPAFGLRQEGHSNPDERE